MTDHTAEPHEEENRIERRILATLASCFVRLEVESFVNLGRPQATETDR